MSLSDLSDPQAVLRAIAEFDELGRDAFLAKYRFGPSRRYQIRHNGRLYDVKAIAGAAHGFQFPDAGPLSQDQFTSGLGTTVPKLQSLGFEIEETKATERREPESEARSSWIFQSNPRYFDIAAAVRSLDEMNWTVAQSKNQIHAGDRVYVWQSGPSGGIIAIATILTDPAMLPSQEGAEFIVDQGKFAGEQLRVRLSIDRALEQPLTRETLQEHPVLSELSILRFANATNYKLKPEQDAAIRALVGDEHALGQSVWWVCQGSSYRAEREGGYVWAPLEGRDGRPRAHWEALREARPGDSVLHYANGAVRAVGTVLGGAEEAPRPAELSDEQWSKAGLRVDIDYRDLETPITLGQIPVAIRRPHGAPFTRDGAVQQGYFFPLKDDLVEYLAKNFPELGLESGGISVERHLSLQEIRSTAEAPPFNLQIDGKIYAALAAALESGKHVVLTGPPGTAKTTLAQVTAVVAKRLHLSDGYLLTTATADWTTYETIGGLRPSEQNRLVFAAGHFLEAIEKNQWLIIDELNRSQFDRAFGQLFTVLSGQPVTLPYKRVGQENLLTLVPAGADPPGADVDPLFIPSTWRIVATMNVFDKSLLFEMSYALMRRFAFIEIPSPPEQVFRGLIEEAAGGDAGAAGVAGDLLRVREVKDIGPAVFQDIARFAAEHGRIGLVDPAELRSQSFYSYLLPQFEGVTDEEGAKLLNILTEICGSDARGRLRQTLTDVLGVELRSGPSAADTGGEIALGSD